MSYVLTYYRFRSLFYKKFANLGEAVDYAWALNDTFQGYPEMILDDDGKTVLDYDSLWQAIHNIEN